MMSLEENQSEFYAVTAPSLVTQLSRLCDILERAVTRPKPALPMPNLIEQAHGIKWELKEGAEKIVSEYPLTIDGEWAMNLRMLGFVPDNAVGAVEDIMRIEVDNLSDLSDGQFKMWAAKATLALYEVWKAEGILK